MNIRYYNSKGTLLISKEPYDFNEIPESAASGFTGRIYALTKMNPAKSRKNFCVTSPSMLFLKEEVLELILEKKEHEVLPQWLIAAINERRVISHNTNYPGWEKIPHDNAEPSKKLVSLAGMGDVGGILCSGLRLLGADSISKIKIYDKDPNKIRRWELECNSILPSDENAGYPEVTGTSEEDIFNCDIFAFCVSVGVPAIGKEDVDVRLAQLKGNAAIVSHYARLARNCGYKGQFAVVSDPVDMLCKAAFVASNKDENGLQDFKGLAPEQIKGYGLGVMYARAAYYSRDLKIYNDFLREGRAFGPHGQGLVIANSIENYDEGSSAYLTKKASESNLEVRSAGFKPYIAPALSSGSLSLLSSIKGNWHYSSNFLGGVYLGCRNRMLETGTEIETYSMPDALYKNIKDTYNYLNNYSENLEV
ncbi:MAG: lactate dehydrogenase [Clostridiaceae bacterium]